MTSVSPINPVDFMDDIVVDEAMRKKAVTPAEKQQAFDQMLVEEIFLRDIFSTDNSIFKPEKEEDADITTSQWGAVYNQMIKKNVAEQIVNTGYFNGAESGLK